MACKRPTDLITVVGERLIGASACNRVVEIGGRTPCSVFFVDTSCAFSIVLSRRSPYFPAFLVLRFCATSSARAKGTEAIARKIGKVTEWSPPAETGNAPEL